MWEIIYKNVLICLCPLKTFCNLNRFELYPFKTTLIFCRYVRLTSSLQETVASPWAFLALQVYTPPSKLQGLRISSEQMPWLEIWRNFGSSPMIIWFFNHSILGWEKKLMNSLNYWQYTSNISSQLLSQLILMFCNISSTGLILIKSTSEVI